MSKLLHLFLTSSLLVISGCKSAKIIEQKGITPPTISTSESIEKAIKDGVLANSKRGWIVEKSNNHMVVTGTHIRNHYLQITYFYDTNNVYSRITDSQNLSQKDGRIHQNAIKWKQELDNKVFNQVSRL